MHNPLCYECCGSTSVSGQLPTYPSPNPTLTVVGLGQGWVGSCSDTDIDPMLLLITVSKSLFATPPYPKFSVFTHLQFHHLTQFSGFLGLLHEV